MPLRASKMKGFILGFQRRVWCPKWTPPSSNSLTPIVVVMFTFPMFASCRRNFGAAHPAEKPDSIRCYCGHRAHTSDGYLRPFPFEKGRQDNKGKGQGNCYLDGNKRQD